ncbi:MAG: hypothetical protein LBG14_04905 [Treponema sp.]|nr:hypothetical protein [Treponema sp.]
MNNKVYRELDSLYDGFMGLTAEGQKEVVETAQSLLEAQREIESLMEKTGSQSPAACRGRGKELKTP